MSVSAKLIRDLRQRTGAGMLDCKKVLDETHGDIEKAVIQMRKKGLANATKKAGRLTAEGVIAIRSQDQTHVMLEVNSETDFVARDSYFLAFVDKALGLLLVNECADVDALLAMEYEGKSLEEHRQELVSRVGENITMRRFHRVSTLGTELLVATYVHSHRIGVLVSLAGGDSELGKDIAMHIAASNVLAITEEQLPQAILEKEREIFLAQEKDNGKPAEITEKIVQGRLDKFIRQVVLLRQVFVKNPDITIADLLGNSSAEVTGFHRYELGEGIARSENNFVDEVMAQAQKN